MTDLLTELPAPERAAHTITYPGRVNPADIVGLVVGPTTRGEYLTGVKAAGDSTTTVAGFVYGALMVPVFRATAFGTLYRANPHRPWKPTPR